MRPDRDHPLRHFGFGLFVEHPETVLQIQFATATQSDKGQHEPNAEAVKKLGQAPSRTLIFQGFRCFGSEPVPFFHSLDGQRPNRAVAVGEFQGVVGNHLSELFLLDADQGVVRYGGADGSDSPTGGNHADSHVGSPPAGGEPGSGD